MIATADTPLDLQAAYDLVERLTKRCFHERPRRVLLSRVDSDILRVYMRHQNDEWEKRWRDDSAMAIGYKPPWPKYIDQLRECSFRGLPCWLDREETALVQWDDYEAWLVLSATCFTPNPK